MVDCVFLGYAHNSIAYRFLIVKSKVYDMHVETIFESRDATFFENIFPMKYMRSNAKFSTEIAPDNTIPIESPVESFEQTLENDDNEVLVRNKRQTISKSFGDDFIVYLVDDTPTSIIEAYASPDVDDWK
jgi:hypothetical protein